MNDFNFSAASREETYVYGAQRPGYNSNPPILDNEVKNWIDFMKQQRIERVCCLLKEQLTYYESSLLAAYKHAFGEENLCSAPIKDFTLADKSTLIEKILPFITTSVIRKQLIVVHCSGGIGRTGHVLAAWLVYGRHMTNREAISAVIDTGRNPYEAVGHDSLGKLKLHELLDACRLASINLTL
jgi:protein-tyrosine phosphatase